MEGSTAACTIEPAIAASAAFPTARNTSIIVSVMMALSVVMAAWGPVTACFRPGSRM